MLGSHRIDLVLGGIAEIVGDIAGVAPQNQRNMLLEGRQTEQTRRG
jgi:hypothetical protein